MRSRILCVTVGLLIKAFLYVLSIYDAWRYPPWKRPVLLTRLSVNGETVVFLARGYEWFCTASGWSKQEIQNRGHCCHGGPCAMDVRKSGP